jgi:hypothetical protein
MEVMEEIAILDMEGQVDKVDTVEQVVGMEEMGETVNEKIVLF